MYHGLKLYLIVQYYLLLYDSAGTEIINVH
jgi:hypothetical protein